MKHLSLALAGAALLVSGCVLGPDYERPAVDVPPAYRDSARLPPDQSIANQPWWEVFQDPVLQKLIEESLSGNWQLKEAIARVQQAQQIVTIAGAPLWPQVNASFGASYYDGSTRTSPPQGNAGLYQLGLGASWLVDIWGQTQRAQESAQAEYLATEDARDGVVIALVSAVAQTYLALRELDLELEISRENLKVRSDTLALFRKQLEGGIASELEVAAAQADYSNIEAAIPAVLLQIAIQENALCVLLGRNPGPIERGTSLVDQQFPPQIPAGMPSALLERRPDVRGAEELLVSANAQVGVAYTQFFPQFDITAALGFASEELADLLQSGAGTWAVGGGLFQPIFQGGAITANYEASKANWEAVRARYIQTVLQAFAEVANSLVSIEQLRAQRAALETAVQAFQDRVRLSNLRYDNGLSSYLEVLNAQQDLYPAQLNLARTQLSQVLAIVQLYQALGGGWEQVQAPQPSN